MNVSDPVARGLLQTLLGSGKAVSIRATGRSMRPFLSGGEVLTIKPVRPSEIRLGDLILWKQGEHNLVLHRVIAVEPSAGGGEVFLTKGDGKSVPDVPVNGTNVLGRVSAVEREVRGGAARIDLECRRWRWASLLLALAHRAKWRARLLLSTGRVTVG